MATRIPVLKKTTSANTTYYDMSHDDHKEIISRLEVLYILRQEHPCNAFTKRSKKSEVILNGFPLTQVSVAL